MVFYLGVDYTVCLFHKFVKVNMIPQRDSIASIYYDGDAWCTVLISSEKVAPLHSIVFKKMKSAKTAAELWAKTNNSIYLSPEGSFVSVVRVLPRFGRKITTTPLYSLALINLKDGICTTGEIFTSFYQAVNAAANSVVTKPYPLVPNFVIAKFKYTPV